jgi:hypothetical protein
VKVKAVAVGNGTKKETIWVVNGKRKVIGFGMVKGKEAAAGTGHSVDDGMELELEQQQ